MTKREQVNLGHLYGLYRRKARKRKIEFKLSLAQFRKLTKSPCWLCGAEPAARYVRSKAYASEPYIYNGIDRVENGHGYTSKNAAACCWKCNQMKGARTILEFVTHLYRIIDNIERGD
jgi:hypothetical protein